VIKGVAPGKSFHLKIRLCGGWIRFRTAKAVRPVIGSSAAIAVNSHETVSLVTLLRPIPWSVYRDEMVIGPQPMDVSVMIGKNPCMKHFVG
jgi:hypothetical protein